MIVFLWDIDGGVDLVLVIFVGVLVMGKWYWGWEFLKVVEIEYFVEVEYVVIVGLCVLVIELVYWEGCVYVEYWNGLVISYGVVLFFMLCIVVVSGLML